MDTQKPTTTNQQNEDSVQQDPKQIQDNENGDIELKNKDTGRGVETDRPMVQDETREV